MLTTQKSAIGTAPGKLNVLGGFGNFNGSITLQTQTESKTTVLASDDSNLELKLSSTLKGQFKTKIQDFALLCESDSDKDAFFRWLIQCEAPEWTHHVIASLFIFSKKFRWFPNKGISFAISSDIPTNLGVSSSVALELSSLRALEKLSGNYFKDSEMATAVQSVENQILGRLCPLENPLTSAFGRPGCLLPIESDSFKLRPSIDLPKGVVLAACSIGTNSENFQTAPIAAQMGSQIIKKLHNPESEYNSTLTPSKYFFDIDQHLPENLTGTEFEQEFGLLEGSIYSPQNNLSYPVKEATRFAILESNRCRMVIHMLSSMIHNAKRKSVDITGELMLQSYIQSRPLGIGTPTTDALFDIITQLGPHNGVYGARMNSSRNNNFVMLLERSSIRHVRNAVESRITNPDNPINIIH